MQPLIRLLEKVNLRNTYNQPLSKKDAAFNVSIVRLIDPLTKRMPFVRLNLDSKFFKKSTFLIAKGHCLFDNFCFLCLRKFLPYFFVYFPVLISKKVLLVTPAVLPTKVSRGK